MRAKLAVCFRGPLIRAIKSTTLAHACSTNDIKLSLRHLSVSLQVESVVSLPRLPPSSSRLVVAMTLAETTRFLASGGETTGFAVLVNRVDDPVDPRISADGLVLRVDENDLKVLVGRVLVDPVRVQDAQIGAAATDTLLGG